jgi:hypothetical protein
LVEPGLLISPFCAKDAENRKRPRHGVGLKILHFQTTTNNAAGEDGNWLIIKTPTGITVRKAAKDSYVCTGVFQEKCSECAIVWSEAECTNNYANAITLM